MSYYNIKWYIRTASQVAKQFKAYDFRKLGYFSKKKENVNNSKKLLKPRY